MNRSSFEAQLDHFRRNFAIFAGTASRPASSRLAAGQKHHEQRRKEVQAFYNLYYMGVRTP